MYHQQSPAMALPSPSMPSPTLTNPDMILPYDGDHSHSHDLPSPIHAMPPPSPPRHPSAGLSSHPPFAKLAHPPLASERIASSANGPDQKLPQGRPLSDIPETETTPKGRRSQNDLLNIESSSPPFASSPTLAPYAQSNGSLRIPSETRRTTSGGSSSGLSDYYGYDRDEHAIEDDSDEEMTTYGEDEEDVAELENIKRLRRARLQYHGGVNGAIPEESQDPYLSAALSKRAEKILANAKRRLDNMEGNLNRARNSLIISSSPLISSSADGSPSLPQGPYSTIHGTERRLHPPLGISPAKHRQVKLKSDVASTGGHSRVFSETSIPSTLNTTPRPNRLDTTNIRSISAFENENSTKPKGSGLSPAAVAVLKGIRREESEEALRNKALQADSASPNAQPRSSPSFERHLTRVDEENHSLARQLSTSASLYNINAAETTEQASGLSRSRSTAQMRDLRVQMNDLKGKISTLQQKAREEGLKRRSLQSLRTPSPFTAAEQWYTTSADFKPALQRSNLGEAVAEPALSPEKPNPRPPAPERHDSALKEENTYAESSATSLYHDVDEEKSSEISDESHEDLIQAYQSSETSSNGSHHNKALKTSQGPGLDDSDSVGERHEDREDAFDYQNFFLHSGMGNYSHTDINHRARDSCSSTDSVETTRGINTTAPVNRYSNHQRNISSDSVSTVASFATATEGFASQSEDSGSDDDRDPARHLPSFGISGTQVQQQYPQNPHLAQFTSPRSPPKPGHKTSASEVKVQVAKPTVLHTAISSYQPSIDDTTPTTREFPLINRSKSVASMQTNGRLPAPEAQMAAKFVRATSSPSPSDSLERTSEGTSATSISAGHPGDNSQLSHGDRALVEALVEAMGDVCVRLKREEGGPRAGIWRGRLEAARRVLEGEVL